MKKFIIPTLAVAAFAALAFMGGYKGDMVEAQTSTSSLATITVNEPDQNDIVSSPIAVSGTATGPWYFEGSFPVVVRNSNGTVIGQGSAQAQGNWMTTSSVPFTGSISFTNPGTATGTVTFERANPSGLPANASSAVVVVRFTAGAPNTGVGPWWLNLFGF